MSNRRQQQQADGQGGRGKANKAKASKRHKTNLNTGKVSQASRSRMGQGGKVTNRDSKRNQASADKVGKAASRRKVHSKVNADKRGNRAPQIRVNATAMLGGQQSWPSAARATGQPGGQRGGGGSFLDQFGGEEGGGFAGGPITGAEYTQWSDRLRDVEEMLDVPELRAEAARIRDRARNARQDLKRHSKEPQWDLVKMEIAGPLVELRTRISEELARRESKEALVPIDRDPVPRVIPNWCGAITRNSARASPHDRDATLE